MFHDGMPTTMVKLRSFMISEIIEKGTVWAPNEHHNENELFD